MFKATEVERKIREINLLINMQIKLSSCKTSYRYFSVSLQRLSWDSLGTKNLSSMHGQNFWKVNKSWRQKRCGRYHIVYPPEIIKTSTLGKPQKKSLEHKDCLHVASVLQRRVKKPPMDNIPGLQNYFQINCQSVIPMFLTL